MTSGPAEVFDLGYQGYDGERTGRWARRGAIWRDGVRISLGLGRGTGAKIAPWLLLGLALVPIVVLVVISAFLGPAEDADDFELPSYVDYYDWAIVPLGLFAAVVAPLLICPDRRDGVLALYAARPITPLDYVGALGGVPHRVAVRVAARGDPLRLERARRGGSPGRSSPTTGMSSRDSWPRGRSSRRC